MKSQSCAEPCNLVSLSLKLLTSLTLWLLVSFTAAAVPLTIKVVGVAPDGSTIAGPTEYRWTVEQDATKYSQPGKTATVANYSFSMHTSYMPVIAAGRVGTERAHTACDTVTLQPGCDPDVFRLYHQALPSLDPGIIDADHPEYAKRYYVSIAAEGFQMGSAPVVFNSTYTAATATVYLNQYPLATAQISVFVFNDNSPINGAPNLPAETGLAKFHVRLIEAGGTYGASGGEVTQDAFGNPLGTTYNSEDPSDIKTKGTGIIFTDASGVANIKNLYPGKYTIIVDPPPGGDWHQTSTIEGTRGIDAWVKNNEPSFFQEFGPPGHHAFVGFVRSGHLAGNTAGGNPCQPGTPGCRPVLSGSGGFTVTGRIVNTHHSRPPVYTFYRAAPVPECWVALQEAGGRALYARACNKDSTFSFEHVPTGDYQIVVWDDPLDIIISTSTVAVRGADVDLKDLPVSSWYGRYQGRVFQDIDGTGLPFFAEAFDRPHIEVDPVTGIEREVRKAYAAGELKPPFGSGIASNIRFRDGSIYQSVTTKPDGTFAFTELFPFFNHMIAEIDYARFKATGATIVVDDGGRVNPVTNKNKLWEAKPGLFGANDPALAYDPWTRLNPQLQQTCEAADVAANTDANGKIIDYTACFKVGAKYYRTEQGVILLEAIQTFLGQTHHIEWGKQPYAVDENGGIAGIVHYAITRAEDDPRYAAAEPWEPGVPRVQVNMFLDCDGDGIPDQPLNDGSGQCVPQGLSGAGYAYDPPDVDNYPYCWRDAGEHPDTCPSGTAMGPEDVKRSRTGGAVFSYGDVFRWGAPGNPDSTQQPEIALSVTDSWDASIPTGCPDPTPFEVPFSGGVTLDCFDGLRNYGQVRPAVFDGGYAFGRVAGQPELPMVIGAQGKGTYIVEAVAPPGYLHQGNGDKNVVFGDTLKAATAALPFECVGMTLPVPQFLTLFPGETNPNWAAGQTTWRKCDMKAVRVLPGTNPAPDFWLFTEAPVAGHGVGFILDDTSAEFNYLSPNFGEKHSPPHLPISIQDWTGREIDRVYSDQYGSYNFLVPSSFTINPPFPSGVMPNMMVACMNHPGPIKVGVNPDGSDKMGLDPYFNRSYSQFCYTLQYLAGKTTYLDTPVLPVAAFAAVDRFPLDCDCADGTPTIYSVTNGNNGPWVPGPGTVLTIVSVGPTQVLNPAFDPNKAPGDVDYRPRTITRDYGFGATPGVVRLGNTVLTINSWADGIITATVPAGASTGQLSITRGGADGKSSIVGLTVHVGGPAPIKVSAAGGGDFKTIQAAIDSVTVGGGYSGRLITVAPGTYKEYVIMDKRVTLQGWGAGSTVIDAARSAAITLANWRAQLSRKLDPRPDGSINPDTGLPNYVPGPNRTFDTLPGQTLGFNPANNEPLLFGAEEGPGILVVGRQGPGGLLGSECLNGNTAALKIDGLTITGGDAGGGVLASGYACGVEVSNNRVVSNYGTYGGGIRIGHTVLTSAAVAGGVLTFTDGVNRSPNIHHNWVSQNGATEAGGGGGVTLGKGSNQYTVADNYICGNFSLASGGGLSHLGLSAGSMTTSGANSGAVGTANLIARNQFIFNQTFNQSADPMGAGLSIASQIPAVGLAFEGTGDVVVDRNLLQGNQAGAGAGGGVSIALTTNSDDILLTNNMVVNNIAGYSGGGVAMSSIGTGVRLINNTIASNVSTATNRQSWTGGFDGGPSDPQIAGVSVLGGAAPELLNNILWGNRSYIYLIEGTVTGLFNPGTAAIASPSLTPVFQDLGRVGPGAELAPRYSVLTTDGVGNSAWLTGTTGCTNTAPDGIDNLTREAIRCNRGVPYTENSPLFVNPIEFVSLVDPTQPINLQDSTVALLDALTFDETGNFVNIIFSPLTLWETTGPNVGKPRADYHLGATAIALNNGRARGTNTGAGNAAATNQIIGANFVPTTDFDAEPRSAAVDIGADEFPSPVPAITSISPASGAQSSTVTVAINGSSLAGATGVTVSGTGVTCTVVTSTSTTASASCVIAANAATGVRTLSITTPNGTSNAVNFTVTAPVPTLTSITPATSGIRPTTGLLNPWNVMVTITGTNLTGTVAGNFNIVRQDGGFNGVIAVNQVTVNPEGTVVSARLQMSKIPAVTPAGVRLISVTRPGGTSNTVTFTVQ